MRRRIAYIDALKILGAADSRVLSAIDRLLGGAIISSAIITGQLELFVLLHVRDEILKQSSKLLAGLGQRVRDASGRSRTELLMAAHAVVAVNAYFEAFSETDLPVDLKRLNLTGADQLTLLNVTQEQPSPKLVDELLSTQLPLPTPHRPYEQVLLDMKVRYGSASQQLMRFIEGAVSSDRSNSGRWSHDFLKQ